MTKAPTITRSNPRRKRAGAAMLLMLLLLVVILGMVAFSVDAGLMVLLRAEVQNAVDAGALAAGLELQDDPNDVAKAEDAVRDYVQRNRVGITALVAADAIDVEAGKFDEDLNTFTAFAADPNAVRVFARQDNQPFFFARVFGQQVFGAPAEAIASSDPRPLDIMMVLDLTGSMKQQGRIGALQNAAPIFIDTIEALDGDDQIGMMGITAEPGVYDPVAEGHSGTPYNSGLHPTPDYRVAVLEAVMTNDFSYLRNTVLTKSNLIAGKYGGWTGIGAGIGDAAHYLTNAAEVRDEAHKVIVLMTDGEANKPTNNGPKYARRMARYAARRNIIVYTISLGNSADVKLNKKIADLTGGQHFDARGAGERELTQKLTEAFKNAAAAIKRVQLVK